MATSKKPRKKYKPRPIARPLADWQRRDIESAARIHVNKLWNGTLDAQGWNTIAAHFNMASLASNGRLCNEGMAALESIRERQRRTGKYGATGDERASIMADFETGVQFIGGLSDVRLLKTIEEIYRRAA